MSTGCGKKGCGVSTGIMDETTFGSGALDHNGYWDKPCMPCALAWKKDHPNDTVWPFPREDADLMNENGVLNQCDGCRAGKACVKLVNGEWVNARLDERAVHIMGDPERYADLMGCEKELYK